MKIMNVYAGVLAMNVLMSLCASAQQIPGDATARENIRELIGHYTKARETKDTVLLRRILDPEIDQLVSSGEWRTGVKAAIDGMLQSSEGNPGTRKIIVDKLRFLAAGTALADARYEIQNSDGSVRKMWSTFVVVYKENTWKIAAIRNMLPAGQR